MPRRLTYFRISRREFKTRPIKLVYSTEGNRLRRYDIDTIDDETLIEDVLIASFSDDNVDGKDVNGGICVSPTGGAQTAMKSRAK